MQSKDPPAGREAQRRDPTRVSARAKSFWGGLGPWWTSIGFTAVGVAVVVGLLFGATESVMVDRSSTCPASSKRRLKVYTVGKSSVKLSPIDRSLRLSFKESRRVLSKRVLLFATPRLHTVGRQPPPKGARTFFVQAEFEDELADAGDASLTQLPGFGVIGRQVTDAGNLRICVQFDPGQLHRHELGGVAPGVYTGIVRISSPTGGTLDEYALPITASFRSSPWEAFGWAFGGFVFGVLVKILSEMAAGSPKKEGGKGKAKALIAYTSQWSYLLAFFGGALTVVLAFTQLYGNGASWGSGDFDWLKLFGTCLAGQLSGTGVADLAKRAVSGQPTV